MLSTFDTPSDPDRHLSDAPGGSLAVIIVLYRYCCILKYESTTTSSVSLGFLELTRLQRGYKALEGLTRFDYDFLIPLLSVGNSASAGLERWNQTRKKRFRDWGRDSGQRYEYNRPSRYSTIERCLMHVSELLDGLRGERRRNRTSKSFEAPPPWYTAPSTDYTVI